LEVKVMTTSTKLIEIYERNHWVIRKQTEGLSHADSLLQLPFRANCLNWVLGHILVDRDKVLDLLGAEMVLSEEETAAYQRGSEPIVDGEAGVGLERLLEALKETQERLLANLGEVGEERLGERISEENERTVGQRIEFSQWHEAYHTGQLEILRQLAGTDDAIIE
jgi:hypothetical protein